MGGKGDIPPNLLSGVQRMFYAPKTHFRIKFSSGWLLSMAKRCAEQMENFAF